MLDVRRHWGVNAPKRAVRTDCGKRPNETGVNPRFFARVSKNHQGGDNKGKTEESRIEVERCDDDRNGETLAYPHR